MQFMKACGVYYRQCVAFVIHTETNHHTRKVSLYIKLNSGLWSNLLTKTVVTAFYFTPEEESVSKRKKWYSGPLATILWQIYTQIILWKAVALFRKLSNWSNYLKWETWLFCIDFTISVRINWLVRIKLKDLLWLLAQETRTG